MGPRRRTVAIGAALLTLVAALVGLARAGDDGLVAAYSFDEHAGPIVHDSSGNSNDGAIDGATWDAGRFGSSLSFDGASDMVTVPNAESLGLGAGMTVEAWVRPRSASDWTSIVEKEAPSGLAYGLYASTPYGGGGGWIRTTRSSTDVAAQTDVRPPIGRWSHIAATYDGHMIRYYVDGTQVATGWVSRRTRPIIDTTGALRIGGNRYWGEWFDGNIDEVRIYDRPLAESEIRDDASTPVSPTTAGDPDPVTSTTAPPVPPTSNPSTTTSTSTTTTTTQAPPPPTTAPPSPVPAEPAGLPGVTLRPVDGGPDYFARWANSFPTDPSFFPIGVWAETLANGTADVTQYQSIGVNTFTNPWNGLSASQYQAVSSVPGMYAIGDPNDFALGLRGNASAGYLYTDEPDGNNVCGWLDESWLTALCSPSGGRTSPLALQDMSAAVRAKDPTRPVYMQFTKPVALSPGQGLSDAQAAQYVASGDIVSYDWYLLTDPYGDNGSVWQQADAVRHVRDLAGRTKPVWPFIETSEVFPDGIARPTPADVNAEVWNALIGGARGIQYFNHNFYPGRSTQHLLIDPAYADIRAQVTRTNAQVARLAPVLNAPYADGYATAPTTLNTMVKAYGGSYYLFTAPRQKNALTATIGVRAGTTVEVVDEGRTLTITNGTFTDSYANQNTIHIYKITP